MLTNHIPLFSFHLSLSLSLYLSLYLSLSLSLSLIFLIYAGKIGGIENVAIIKNIFVG